MGNISIVQMVAGEIIGVVKIQILDSHFSIFKCVSLATRLLNKNKYNEKYNILKTKDNLKYLIIIVYNANKIYTKFSYSNIFMYIFFNEKLYIV
jgi:hypothetical protein